MAHIVYRPSDKALRRASSTKFESNDRMVFTGRDTALWFKAGTNELLMLDMLKTHDSHVVATDEQCPVTFTISRRLLCSDKAYVDRVCREFNVKIM